MLRRLWEDYHHTDGHIFRGHAEKFTLNLVILMARAEVFLIAKIRHENYYNTQQSDVLSLVPNLASIILVIIN